MEAARMGTGVVFRNRAVSVRSAGLTLPRSAGRSGKMKCDICKDDFPDDELVEADIMTCDDDGNICEGPKSHVCYMCRTLIVAVGIENQS